MPRHVELVPDGDPCALHDVRPGLFLWPPHDNPERGPNVGLMAATGVAYDFFDGNPINMHLWGRTVVQPVRPVWQQLN